MKIYASFKNLISGKKKRLTINFDKLITKSKFPNSMGRITWENGQLAEGLDKEDG